MASSASSVHVIAEAGTNHGGSLTVAKRLIDVAREAGADSVKFQIIYPEGLYLPQIWEGDQVSENEVFRLREAARLPDPNYDDLFSHATQAQIPLSASVFDERGLELLERADPPYVKIASCDLNNYPFLKNVARTKRKLVISTGMATAAEVDLAVETLTEAGNENLVLLHCVSIYPAPTEIMGLSAIAFMRERYGFPVGLSDHTETSLAAAIAVAEGATWLEKHFTLDRSLQGFDHAYAMEPEGLQRYVEDVRVCEKALVPPSLKVSEAEQDVRKRARRGLYAARDLIIGDALAEEDILIVRPEGPLTPGDLDSVLGRTLSSSLKRYQPLSWSDLVHV